MFVKCCECETKFKITTIEDEYPTICPNCEAIDVGLEIIEQSFWAFQRRDNNSWDLIEEEKFDELPEVIAGSLRIIDAENRAKALEKIIGVEKTIRRIFNDVSEFGSEYAYRKWFTGGKNND